MLLSLMIVPIAAFGMGEQAEGGGMADLRQLSPQEIAKMQMQAQFNARAFAQQQGGDAPVASAPVLRRPVSESEVSVYGQAALYGFMGSNNMWYMNGNGNMKPRTMMQGFGAGLVGKGSAVLGAEIEQLFKREVAPICDSVVGGAIRSTKNVFSRFFSWLFHGGRQPYTTLQIGYWREEVGDVIIGKLFETAVRAERTQSNGMFGGKPRGQNLFDPAGFGGDMPNQAGPQEVVGDAMWMVLIDGLAKDIERIVMRLELSKSYYWGSSKNEDEDRLVDGRADIVDMAQGIQGLLMFIRDHVLLPSRSLKDLAVGDLKNILPSLKEMVDARFKLFSSMVSTYHGVTVKPSSSGSESRAEKAPKRPQANAYSDLI